MTFYLDILFIFTNFENHLYIIRFFITATTKGLVILVHAPFIHIFNAKLPTPEPLFVVLHTPLTHVVVVQVLPEHTVFCVVLCVKALADDVKMSISVRLDMSVSSTPVEAVINNNLLIFVGMFSFLIVHHLYAAL